jgi:hypothetical protein
VQHEYAIDRVNTCLARAGLPPANVLHVPGENVARRRTPLGCALDHLERKLGLERNAQRDGRRLQVGERLAAVEIAISRA